MADRLHRIDPATATEEQKAVIARLGAGRGRIPTPYNIWLHSPGLAAGMEALGTWLNTTTVLSEAELEVAILGTAGHWRSPYVIANHLRHAARAGLTPGTVEALRNGRRPAGNAGRLQAVCDAVFDMLEGGAIDDARFAAHEAALGRAAIAELLCLIGYYTSVSLAMRLHAMPEGGA